MATDRDLVQLLHRIDGRGFKAYKQLKGSYRFNGWTLFVDHVQGDPFAAPSKLRLRVPLEVSGLPAGLRANKRRRIALQDFLARAVRDAMAHETRRSGSGKSGLLSIDAGHQEVLERSALVIAPEWVEARIEIGLPAAGRTILGREAESLLVEALPRVVSRGLHWTNLDDRAGEKFVHTVENHNCLQDQLEGKGLVGFVADGSVLARLTGASDLPMSDAVVFRSPESMRMVLDLEHPRRNGDCEETTITGTAIVAGVTLIVGGGYHGKSTLLKALERGVYPHIPGDGREYVVTRWDAVKIRAEDGRRVANVDISPFIQNLPLGRSTVSFSSDDASGSTSQAANIMEALESGARTLLLDEDTSATNFMVRDARMQSLVAKENEPILPFLDRVRELHDTHGVSTVLVMGGSGDYFDVADRVLLMKDFIAEEVTSQARAVAKRHPTGRAREAASPMPAPAPRVPRADSIDASRGRKEVKIETRGQDQILYGTETIDLRAVEQLVDESQTRAAAYAIHWATRHLMDSNIDLAAMLRRLDEALDEAGVDILALHGGTGEHPGNLARPRRFEIAASLNRLRSLLTYPTSSETGTTGARPR